MLFGVTTMTFFHKPILETLKIIKNCGFDCAEIWADHAWDDKKGATTEELKTILTKLNLQSTIHCPIIDISIASSNQGIREESIRQNFLAIDLARDLGSRLIVIHPGNKFSILEEDCSHWARQVDSISKILDYANKQGVLATIENMDSDKEIVSVKYWANFKRLFADIKSKEMWVTLDLTHLRDTKSILDFIQEAKSHIAHIHLSDGTLKKMHLQIGKGNLKLRQIISELQKNNYTGIYSLECFIPNNTEEKMREELQKAQNLF